MKYYKDKNGNVYAYEADGSQDHLIGDKTEMNDAEIKEHIAPKPTQKTKQQLLESITVTTQSGKTFDGDELSQTRIARALQIGSFTGQTLTAWKLADNTVQQVTYVELQEALTLAMIEVGRIVGAIE